METTNLVVALGPVNRDNQVFVSCCFARSFASPTASGDEGARTLNPRLAKPVLSQLSYIPKGQKNKSQATNHKQTAVVIWCMSFGILIPVGVPEVESGTSSLSATRSNQLSYTPAFSRTRYSRHTRLTVKPATQSKCPINSGVLSSPTTLQSELRLVTRIAPAAHERQSIIGIQPLGIRVGILAL